MRRALLSLLLLGALVAGVALYRSVRPAEPGTPHGGTATAGGPTAREQQAIAKAAAGLGKGVHAATDEDGSNTESRREMESVYAGYHPFFVRGDLDGDGLLDFVQAYSSLRNGRPWFDVAVFFGLPGGGFSEPVWVERGISLADGDVSMERSLVLITPDLAREETRRWRWEPEEKRFEDADATVSAEPQDQDAPDETPDERPRVRV